MTPYYTVAVRRNSTACFSLIAASFLVASCAPAPDTRAAEEAAIRALDEQWSATAAKNDLDGTVAFYSGDAVFLPPMRPSPPSRSRFANRGQDYWDRTPPFLGR